MSPRAHKQRRCHRIPSGRAKPRVWKRVSLVNNVGWTDWQRDRLKQGECDLCPSEELRVQLKWEHRPAQRLTWGLPASSKSVWFILLGKQTDPCLPIFGYGWSSGKRYSAWTSIMAFVQPPSEPQNRARPQELKFGPRKRSLRPSVKSTSPRRPAHPKDHNAPAWRGARVYVGVCWARKRRGPGKEVFSVASTPLSPWRCGAAPRTLASWRSRWAASSCWSRSCRGRPCARCGVRCSWGPRPRPQESAPLRAGWQPPGTRSLCGRPGVGAAWPWGECLRGLPLWVSAGGAVSLGLWGPPCRRSDGVETGS